MNHQTKRNLIAIAAMFFVSASFAHADIVIHELGSSAANTLNALGRDFVVGCAILAVGVVAAVFISKRK